MLDAGTGFYRAIELARLPTLDILLSHAHLDHVFGLTVVLDLMYKSPVEKIRIYGQASKLQAIRDHLFSDLLFPVVPKVEWISLESLPNPFTLAEGQVRWFPLEHPGGSVGYRLDWPQFSLAYVTDTTCRENSEYWHFLNDLDLLVHECNFTDSEQEFAEMTGHSHISPILKQFRRHRIDRLILTHLNPLADKDDPIELQQACDRDEEATCRMIDIAQDLQVLKLESLSQAKRART